MKIIHLFPILLLLTIFVSADNNLYLHESLDLSLDVKGEIELIDQGQGKISNVKTELHLYPEPNFRQEITKWTSSGTTKTNFVFFEWNDQKIETKKYGFNSKIRTKNRRIPITKKINFPLSKTDTQNLDNYLTTTKTIDKDNQKIISQATKLAEGETDLFKVVFNLAKWVEANINYELTTLTTTSSQKASWVLENKKGVCDEMTSLFIAMCRSLGIPARFVSGISYSTSELFEEPWLPHGWAEVFFPGYGWVGFDITFGEYGYVDVTHIKLRDGFDPAEPSTKFEWLSNNVQLKSKELEFVVNVENKGITSPDDIALDQEILGKEVGFGSYNLIKGTVENKGNYYAATTLNLAVPKEVTIIGEKKKVILLKPFESKEVFWTIKVAQNLQSNYWYEFPVALYSEKNVSIVKKFKALRNKIAYSQEEVNKLITPDQGEKTYSQNIDFNCQYKKEVNLNQTNDFSCQLKNKGNTNLQNIKFCLATTCKEISSLPINQVETINTKISGQTPGYQKILVKASNSVIEKNTYLEYTILDQPQIALTINFPKQVEYNKGFTISPTIKKSSFSSPYNVKLVLIGPKSKNQWTIKELNQPKQFLVKSNSQGLGTSNKFLVQISWEDKDKKKFQTKKEINIKITGKNFLEKLKLWLNNIINIIK